MVISATDTRTIEKVNQAISELERLRERVAQIESQYGVLNHDYTRLCEEALSKVAQFKTSIKADNEALERIIEPVVTEKEGATRRKSVHNEGKKLKSFHRTSRSSGKTQKASKLVHNVAKAEADLSTEAIPKESSPCGSSAAQNETTIQIETVPPESTMDIFQLTCLPLEIKHNPTTNLEDIIIFQQEQVSKNGDKVHLSPQSVIDMMASCIETGLDKLGDGFVYPFVKAADLAGKFARRTERKK